MSELTIRDRFALAAMEAMIAEGSIPNAFAKDHDFLDVPDLVVEYAYLFGDAALRESARETPDA